MAHQPVSGLAAEQITIGVRVPANRLVLAAGLVHQPRYEGVPIIGTRHDGLQFPPGFVLPFQLSLGHPVVKGSIHILLNQI